LVVVTQPEPAPCAWALVDHITGVRLDSGLFHHDDLEPAAVEQLRVDASGHGLRHLTSRSEFGELIHRVVYQRRALLAPWDLKDLGRIAVDWTTAANDPYRGGFSLILATKPGTATERNPVRSNGQIENGFRSRLNLRSIDSVRAIIGLTTPGSADRRDRPGTRPVITVLALAEALSGQQLRTLADAAAVWNVSPPPEEDPTITLTAGVETVVAKLHTVTAIHRKALALHRQLSPGRAPHGALSPGTYAAALFEQMGLHPLLMVQPGFDRSILAAGMGGYFNGDVFCAVRATDLPAVKLDFGGLYPVVYHLCGGWELQSAKRIRVYRRNPRDVSRYLTQVAGRIRRWCVGEIGHPPLSARDWRRLARTIVWVIPNGDVLPHRPQEETTSEDGRTVTTTRMEIGPLTASVPIPFYLADVLRSVLDTGALPEIIDAVRLVPWGQQQLNPVRLPTGRIVDPTSEDPILVAAIERIRLERHHPHDPETKRLRGLLKGISVSASSGLPVQILDDEPTSEPRLQQVWDPTNRHRKHPTEIEVTVLETPGRWYFPPLPAGVTATARLVVDLSRLAFEAAGGTVAYWDTDSLFVVATPAGGDLVSMPGGTETDDNGRAAIRALSYADIHHVRWKIEGFSPYPPELRPTTYQWQDEMPFRIQLPLLLKWEPDNDPPPQGFGLPVSETRIDINRSKRYRLYHIIQPGPHVEIHDGRGVVVHPTDEELRLLSRVVVTNPSLQGVTFTQPADAPEQFAEELFAVHIAERLNINQPSPQWRYQTAETLLPVTRPATARILPGLAAHSHVAIATDLFGNRIISHAGNEERQWYDPDTQQPVTLSPALLTDIRVGLVTIPRNLDLSLRRLAAATQPNALDPNGDPPGRNTRGILQPAPTIATSIQRIGKESRRWRDTRSILTPPETTTYNTRTDPEQLIALIRKHYHWRGAPGHIAKLTGLPERTIRAILNGQRQPAPKTHKALERFAVQQQLFDP
jgi:hypothetical protein